MQPVVGGGVLPFTIGLPSPRSLTLLSLTGERLPQENNAGLKVGPESGAVPWVGHWFGLEQSERASREGCGWAHHSSWVTAGPDCAPEPRPPGSPWVSPMRGFQAT